MKKSALTVTLVIALTLLTAIPAFAEPPDNAAHASIASELKGDTAELMPAHVAQAHQAAAADLQGGVSELVPEHVTP